MNKKINLETYDVEDDFQDQRGEEVLDNQELKKKDGAFKRFWNSTVFPEMIKNRKEEKALRKEIQSQARREAMIDMKDDLKQIYIQKEKDKLSGKAKKDWLEKLAKGFESSSVGSTDKLNMMLGNDEEAKSPISRTYTPRPNKTKTTKKTETTHDGMYDTSDDRMTDLLGLGFSSKNTPRNKSYEKKKK